MVPPSGGIGWTQPVQSAAERRLLARDTQFGAIIFTGIATFIGVAWFPVTRAHFDASNLGLLALTVVSASLFTYLVSSYRRPSERRARWATLAMFLAALSLMSWNQVLLSRLHQPHTPFLGHKFLLVCASLVAANRRWLRLVIIFVTAANALVLYFVLHLGAHKDIIPLAEPWVTLVFMALGIAALVMRDQRRVARFASCAPKRRPRRCTAARACIWHFARPAQLAAADAWSSVPRAARGRSRGRPTWTRLRAGIERLIAISREARRRRDSGARR